MFLYVLGCTKYLFYILFQVHTEAIQNQAQTNLLKLICDTYQVKYIVTSISTLLIYFSQVLTTPI